MRGDGTFDALDDLEFFDDIDSVSGAASLDISPGQSIGDSSTHTAALMMHTGVLEAAAASVPDTTPLPVIEQVPATSGVIGTRPLGLVAHSSAVGPPGATGTFHEANDGTADRTTGTTTLMGEPHPHSQPHRAPPPPSPQRDDADCSKGHVAPAPPALPSTSESVVSEPTLQIFAAAEAPHMILWASTAWEGLFGPRFGGSTGVANAMGAIQGSLTAPAAVAAVAHALKTGNAWTGAMISTGASGRPFSHTLRVDPLRDGHGVLRCFHITSLNVSPLTAGSAQQVATRAPRRRRRS